jgi:hypothetical protein
MRGEARLLQLAKRTVIVGEGVTIYFVGLAYPGDESLRDGSGNTVDFNSSRRLPNN